MESLDKDKVYSIFNSSRVYSFMSKYKLYMSPFLRIKYAIKGDIRRVYGPY